MGIAGREVEHVAGLQHPFLLRREPLQNLQRQRRHKRQVALTRKVQQILDDPVHPVDFFENDLRVFGQFRVLGRSFLDQLRKAADRIERIADLVRDAGRHLSQSCQVLRVLWSGSL